jgi:hypothetical protein
MTTNQDQLLDDHNASSVNQLTDYQLIGLLLNKEKFPKEINSSVEFEIQRRKLSEDKIKTLKFKLNNSELIPVESYKGVYNKLLITGLILLACITHFSASLGVIVIVPISTRAIKNRFTKGIHSYKNTWRKFEIFMLLITIILYTLFFLL